MNNNKCFEKLPLDNAAKIYPAAMTKNWNSVFAVSAQMKETVAPAILKQAVEDLSARFPSMYVMLKKEFFWDCFVPAYDYDIVYKESESPCRPFEIGKNNKPLFRVVYNTNEIRVEFFHSVTDGTGAIEYLKALILRYYQIKTSDDFECEGIKNINESVKDYELRDDFQSIYKRGVGATRKDTNSYQVQLETKENYLGVKKYVINVDTVKAIAKAKYNCTVTQYIAALYALALLSQYDSNSKKPVKLAVPVNLRKYFGSQTLRNFSSYVTINVTPDTDYTFEAVLDLIKKGMQEKITKDNFFKAISKNIADERMIISKYSPNVIKRLVMRQAFRTYGEKKYTSTITSIGHITFSKELDKKIDYISVLLGESYLNKINCGVIGFGNKICVTFTSPSENTAVQDEFERLLYSLTVKEKTVA